MSCLRRMVQEFVLLVFLSCKKLNFPPPQIERKAKEVYFVSEFYGKGESRWIFKKKQWPIAKDNCKVLFLNVKF